MNNKSFDYKRIAEGYKNRPYLHKQVLDRFRREITDRQFHLGIDIGCGAGLSTKALKDICDVVVGVDISEEMIHVAKEVCDNDTAIQYLVCKAEDIPVQKEKINIVTAAGAIQWIDRERFLNRLSQIMADQGYLLIYDFSISDEMKENSMYTDWWYDLYLVEFPKPYRNEYVWQEEDVKKYGFHIVNQVPLEMEYEFDLKHFIEFMMIQSNVNNKIEGEGRNIEEVRSWFQQSLASVFTREKETLVFKGYCWYIQKQ